MMSVNLLNLFREHIEEQLIHHTNLPSGIPPEKIRTFIGFLVPSLLSGVIRKGATEDGASEVYEFLKKIGTGDADDDRVPGQSESAGTEVLQFLFDHEVPALQELFSKHTGISIRDIEALLSPSSVLFLKELYLYVQEKSIDELGLYNLLGVQHKEGFGTIPRNIRGFPLIDPGPFGNGADEDENADPTPGMAGKSREDFISGDDDAPGTSLPPIDDDSSQFGKILPWIILALASLALLWFLSKKEDVVPEDETKTSEIRDAGTETGENPDDFDGLLLATEESGEDSAIVIQLPDSSQIVTSRNSFVKRIFDVITGDSMDTDRSFVLGEIEFNSGTAEIVPGTEHQLVELARVLTAFPKVTIRVVAHTENDGNPSGNLELSNRRADAIQNWLIEHGIKASRVDIFGMGQEEPLESNETQEGRNQNRRIEVFLVSR